MNLTPSIQILLADDNLINQEIGEAMLAAIGFETDVVSNGLEAVKACAGKHYDLILMDCHMPKMDGFEAATLIRQQEKEAGKSTRTPIIALTADVQKGIVDLCLAAGMDDYLSKPFYIKQLQAVLDKWLGADKDKTTAIVQTPTPHQPVARRIALDANALENLRCIVTDSGETLLNKAILMFLESAPNSMESLRANFESRDLTALYKAAHSFKSSCGNLGAKSLQQNAAAIEAIAKQNRSEGVEALLCAMEVDFHDVLAALERELDSPTDKSEPPSKPAEVTPPKNISSTPTKEAKLVNAKRILLVDDDPNFRSITRTVLTLAAFLVDEAENGTQALEKIAQRVPDMVLLDAIMDGIDGFETCRLMREDPRMADVPIVMSTGLGDVDSINLAFHAGATDFIVKPINYPILVHQINFIFKASQNTQELRSSKHHLQELNITLQDTLVLESKLREVASRFVPNEFLSLLGYDNLIDVCLGDAKQQDLTVLFCDIRNFASMSEKLTVTETFKFINSYISHMEPIITSHRGFIDKYIGDAIMALFGAKADDALKAAIAMINHLVVYNGYRKNCNYNPIKIGIGINTGSLILGTVGVQNRMDGTVIGDAVNLSSRLEGLTKKYGTSIIISHHAFLALDNPNDYAIRMIDTVNVKGKMELVTIYEVFDADPEAVKTAKLATLDLFNQAILAYHAQQFILASSLFTECLEACPEDSVSTMYLGKLKQQLS